MGPVPSIYTIWEGFSRGIRVVPASSIQTTPPQLSPFLNSESVKICRKRRAAIPGFGVLIGHGGVNKL